MAIIGWHQAGLLPHVPGAVGGFSKTIFAACNYRILLHVIFWLLAGLAFLEPVCRIILNWIHIPLPAPLVEFAALSIVLSLSTRPITSLHLHFPIYLMLFYPVDLVLYIWVAAYSFSRPPPERLFGKTAC
jgi:hypothetical protein